MGPESRLTGFLDTPEHALLASPTMPRLLLLVAAVPALASAGDLDLDLSRFATVYRQGETVGSTTIDCGRAPGDFCYADTILLSGHGPETTVGREKRSNPFVPPE